MNLENLRRQAEAETSQSSATRRPSWAPALVLTGELPDICRSLEWLSPGDKPVARLWAVFADPQKLGTWQRDHISAVPLHGHRVRGFELIAGEQRLGRQRLFRTLKGEDGVWRSSGTRWKYPAEPWDLRNAKYQLDLDQKRLADPVADEASLRADYERHRWDFEDEESVEDYIARRLERDAWQRAGALKRIPELEAKIAASEHLHQQALQRYHWCFRVFELGKQRLAEFLGDPEAEMLAGSRVTGRCSRCGALLTDPLSIERGIGPECIKRVAWHKVVPDLLPVEPRIIAR
jgi:hypothetical protein